MILNLIPVGPEEVDLRVVEDYARARQKLGLLEEQGGDGPGFEVEVALESGLLECDYILEPGQTEEGQVLEMGAGEVGGIGEPCQAESRLIRKDRSPE